MFVFVAEEASSIVIEQGKEGEHDIDSGKSHNMAIDKVSSPKSDNEDDKMSVQSNGSQASKSPSRSRSESQSSAGKQL